MLEYLLTSRCAAPAPTVSFDGWAIAALFIGPAVVAAIISLLALWPASKLRRKEAADIAKWELKTRAQMEFYSPIRELLNEVKVLRDGISDLVNPAKDPNWHTLDHMKEIKRDPVAWALFESVVATNERIKQLLDEKSGLARGAVTASALWRVHQSLLVRALANPKKAPSTELSYFPTDFEKQINKHFDALSAELGAHSATDKKGKNS